MTYITRNASPINDKTFSTRDEAVGAFCAPAYAGAPSKEITWDSETSFRCMGERYEVAEGENPTAARAAAKASIPARMDAATPAQIAYLNKLSYGVPASAYAHWVTANMSKAEASRAIVALKVIFSH